MLQSTDNPDLAILKSMPSGKSKVKTKNKSASPELDSVDNSVDNPVDNQDEETTELVDNPQEDQAEATPDSANSQTDGEAENEEEDALLLEIMRKAETEDVDIRYPMLVRAKRNELYFNNIQKIVYDEVARDYRNIDDIVAEMENLASISDIKTNNVYRAFAESLIAALSVSPPTVEFIPDDAENPEDLETAEAYTHIAELLNRHNHAQLMLIKALTILFNQGVVCAYNFTRQSPDYGTYHTYTGSKTKQVPVVDIRCKECGELLDSSIPANQFNPATPVACPTCNYTGMPDAYQQMENMDEPEYEDTPKSRSLYELFGCTQVKIPIYAKKQSDIGYIILRIDDNLAKFKSLYDPSGDIGIASEGGDTTKYERWARIPLAYSGAIPNHLTTARFLWIRPWYFYILDDVEAAAGLIKKYPDGVMITVIGDKIVDRSHEKLDDCWTITFDPRANFIHGEPAGNALIPLQDAENDIFNLGLQSIEYGIPETFANPRTLNFQEYSKSQAAPGTISKALPPGPDKNLSDGFFTLKTATLSNEYVAFAQSLTQKTQFTTGAFPSVFGGEQGKSNSTATEYTESNARARQRLQLVWVMISVFWADMSFKGVKLFAKNMSQDEQYSKKEKGTFINIFIQKASLNGRVGHVETEVNSQLPQSWSQKKDFLMSLITLQNPEVGAILLHPNNAELLKYVAGMEEIYIPGEHDRNKQFGEYYELSVGQPIGDQPSVTIDLEVDDHMVHMQVLKNILVGPLGIQLYKTNPTGYQNNIFHYIAHEKAIQAKSMAFSANSPEGQPADTAAKSSQG